MSPKIYGSRGDHTKWGQYIGKLTIDLFEDHKPNLGLLLGPKPYEKFLVSVLPPETKIKTGLSQKISETR